MIVRPLRCRCVVILLLLWLPGSVVAAVEVSLFRGGPQRQGGEGVIPGAVEELWRFKTRGEVRSTPVVAAGRAYITGDDGFLYCLDLKRGTELWRFDARHKDLSTPAVAGGRVFFPSSVSEGGPEGVESRAVLYCLDAASGDELWKKRIPAMIAASPACAAGRVYVVALNKRITCLDAADGKDVWDAGVRGEILSTPIVVDDLLCDLLWFGSDDKCLYCLDAQNGRQQWKSDLKAAIHAAPAASGGRLYVGTTDGVMHCLDADHGKETWKAKTAKGIAGAAAIEGGRVIVGASDGSGYCWDAVTGQRLWKAGVGDEIVGSPCAVAGRAVLGSVSGSLCGIDAKSGRQLWKYQLPAKLISSPTLAGELLLIGSTKGTVHCLGPKKARPAVERTTGPMTDVQATEGIAAAMKFIAAGRYRDAAVVARGVIDARAESAPAHLQLARACEGLEELGPADREYKLAVQLDPRAALYRNAFGKYLARMGRVREAMREFGYAKEYAPSDAEAYLNCGTLLLTEGKTAEAERECLAALDRKADDPGTFLCLAEIYLGKPDYRGARDYLERCLKADPGNARAKTLLDGMGKR
ncbi:MAG: PQQ-binding-like beta-propeller repeat protein [Candidatus Aureabacteria bacterium]|nr:PQQ-binding-like beta-propeller repeat protein [Candidatus Auribacterota bacterium]